MYRIPRRFHIVRNAGNTYYHKLKQIMVLNCNDALYGLAIVVRCPNLAKFKSLPDVTFVKRRLDISSPTFYTGECGIQQEEFFIAPRGLQLLLAIGYVDTNNWGDVFKVGNGNISNEHTVFQYTGGRIVAGISVLSQGNMIWMTFTSDGYHNDWYYRRGLSGYVKAVNMTIDGK